jgi:hypothetical protein
MDFTQRRDTARTPEAALSGAALAWRDACASSAVSAREDAKSLVEQGLALAADCLALAGTAKAPDFSRQLDALLDQLQTRVVALEDADLSARWFLGTRGWRSSQRVSVSQVQAQLRPRSALVLVTRSASDRLMLVVLMRDARGELVIRQHHVPVCTDASLDCIADVQMIDSTLYAGRPVRQGPVQVPAHDPGTHDAARSRMDALANCVMPVIATIASEAADIGLVPSGDMHALPWQHHFSTGLPATVRVRLYASAADWLRLHGSGADATVSCMPRWALAAYDASDTGDLSDRLYWIHAEVELSRRMWRDSGIVDVDAMAGLVHATALLACGHGVAPRGDATAAGVWMGFDEPASGTRSVRLLDATAMATMPAVRRVVLSCCMLGRTHEVLGEPLGLIAQVFAGGAQFATGALVRLADLDAALFSLAFQWSLRSAYARPQMQRHVDWVVVFQNLQAAIRRGHWPAGFSAWLEAELPRCLQGVVPSTELARADDDAGDTRRDWHGVLMHAAREMGLDAAVPRTSQSWLGLYESLARELAARPPESLRRSAPWIVALGS